MDWLKIHHYTNIPIESVVVISNPQTQIKISPGRTDDYKLVTHKINLPEKIRYYDRKHREERISLKEIRKLSKLLLKSYTSPTPNLLQRYQIPQEDIIKGVACPYCRAIPMIRSMRQWYCTVCNTYSTNSQFRDFLQLESRTVAKKLLIGMNLPTSGEYRHRKYHLDFDELKD